MIRVLGFFDLLASILLLLSSEIVFPKIIFIIFAIYLLIKAIAFLSINFASIIDFISGIFLILLFYGINLPFFIFAIFGILLLQKAVFSFLQ